MLTHKSPDFGIISGYKGSVSMQTSTKPRECLYLELSLTRYEDAWKLQQDIVAAKIEGRLESDVILSLEHPPVFTLGRRGGRDNLCVAENFLKQEGIEVVQVERGGDITYHGPGQMVIYVMWDIKRSRTSVTDLVSNLEDIMIRTASSFGVEAERNPLNRGVWVGNAKLGSIGIAIRKGISFHGLALNVSTNLKHFSWINPCGLQNVGMTTLEKELFRAIDLKAVRSTAAKQIEAVMGVKPKGIELNALNSLIKQKAD
jgi:lipoate-protein ligase B